MSSTATTTTVSPQSGNFTCRQRPIIPLQSVQHGGPVFTDNPAKIESFPRGYPSLSAFLSSDREFAMFRSFKRLHARLVLHKQDELVQLEEHLDSLDEAEGQINPHALTTNRPGRHGPTSRYSEERRVLLAEIEVKLREYNSVLTSLLDHLGTQEPEQSKIQNVANWMDGKKPLARAESGFLDDWSDLRPSKHSPEKGGLEELLGRIATSPTCQRIWASPSPKSDDPHVRLANHSKIMAVSRTLATVFAVFALIIPIVVLYNVQAVTSRLWIISGFTALFSSALRWLTMSRNYEIFSATAAYCAVMVVFVGSLPESR
ncbi:hypothetical protein QBC37DRAFT_367395 [Rhypophila decipiens]|uniref:DUF6594 domain-containing protein n=1 Tax=Rhypophila decipiens TaxID=261697 RepID=A0AAN7BEH2_9PEZI|nr:hypothetical protein QBC37DRAFT_367395 [Rhypophila decipiens]